MYIAYNKIDGEIIGWNEFNIPETDHQGVIETSQPIDLARISLHKVNTDTLGVVLKEGQDLEDANAQLLSKNRSMLIKKFAGPSVNPVTLGNLEGATDILAYFLNKVINKEVLYAGEVDKWNSFYSKVSPYFKTKLEDIPNEEDSLAAAKQKARQVETDMKNDPDWNIS